MANRKSSVHIGANLSRETDEEELANDADYQATKREQADANSGADPKTFLVEGLGQIAPIIPVRWIDVENPLFENPCEEYVRSPFPLDLGTLIHRWEGLWTALDIELAYTRENWVHKRFLYQDERDKLAFEASLAKDAQYQTRVLNKDIEQMSVVIERLFGDFISGFEYAKVRGAGAFGYVRMPMTVDSRIKLAEAIKKASQFRGVRVGLVSDMIASENKTDSSVADQLRAAQAEQNDQYSALLKLAGIDINAKAFPSQVQSLPSAQIVEAQVVEIGESDGH